VHSPLLWELFFRKRGSKEILECQVVITALQALEAVRENDGSKDLFKMGWSGWAVVAHACNPDYLGG
jgi:hypothetical protein